MPKEKQIKELQGKEIKQLLDIYLSLGGDEAQISEEYRCPLDKEPLTDPVSLPTGQTCNRVFIMKWIEEKHTNPFTGGPLEQGQLSPNLFAIEIMRSFLISKIGKLMELKAEQPSSDSATSSTSGAPAPAASGYVRTPALAASPASSTFTLFGCNTTACTYDSRGVSRTPDIVQDLPAPAASGGESVDVASTNATKAPEPMSVYCAADAASGIHRARPQTKLLESNYKILVFGATRLLTHRSYSFSSLESAEALYITGEVRDQRGRFGLKPGFFWTVQGFDGQNLETFNTSKGPGNVMVLVIDVNNRKEFNKIGDLLDNIGVGSRCIVLAEMGIGARLRNISKEELQDFASQRGFLYMDISDKPGTSFEEILAMIMEKALQEMPQPRSEPAPAAHTTDQEQPQTKKMECIIS